MRCVSTFKPFRITTVVMTTVMTFAFAVPSMAQQAEKTPSQPATDKQVQPAKKPAPGAAAKVPGTITVTNAAKMLLAGVEISTKEKEPRVVGSLPQGLQPGKSTKVKLRKPKGCEYSVVAVFEDGSEGGVATVDLCKDPQLRFTGS